MADSAFLAAHTALVSAVADLQTVGTLLQAGHKAGDSLQSLRDGQLKSLGGKLNSLATELEDLADAVMAQGDIKVAMINIGAVGNSATGAGSFIAPADLQILGLSAVSSGVPTSDPLLSFTNKPAGDTAVNPLAATDYDMAGLTVAGDAAALGLSATPANLLMSAGDALTALVTCDAGDAIVDATIMVLYKHTA